MISLIQSLNWIRNRLFELEINWDQATRTINTGRIEFLSMAVTAFERHTASASAGICSICGYMRASASRQINHLANAIETSAEREKQAIVWKKINQSIHPNSFLRSQRLVDDERGFKVDRGWRRKNLGSQQIWRSLLSNRNRWSQSWRQIVEAYPLRWQNEAGTLSINVLWNSLWWQNEVGKLTMIGILVANCGSIFPLMARWGRYWPPYCWWQIVVTYSLLWQKWGWYSIDKSIVEFPLMAIEYKLQQQIVGAFSAWWHNEASDGK